MGRFNHEAVAINPRTGIVYETEDQRDTYYRFIPSQQNGPTLGRLVQALKIKNMPQAKTFCRLSQGPTDTSGMGDN